MKNRMVNVHMDIAVKNIATETILVVPAEPVVWKNVLVVHITVPHVIGKPRAIPTIPLHHVTRDITKVATLVRRVQMVVPVRVEHHNRHVHRRLYRLT